MIVSFCKAGKGRILKGHHLANWGWCVWQSYLGEVEGVEGEVESDVAQHLSQQESFEAWVLASGPVRAVDDEWAVHIAHSLHNTHWGFKGLHGIALLLSNLRKMTSSWERLLIFPVSRFSRHVIVGFRSRQGINVLRTL